MPWITAKQFIHSYTDATDYAIGWASPALFYVFFTALEVVPGPDEGERNLYRFQGHWDGRVITWDDPFAITKLGPVPAGSILKVERTESGNFAIFIGTGGS